MFSGEGTRQVGQRRNPPAIQELLDVIEIGGLPAQQTVLRDNGEVVTELTTGYQGPQAKRSAVSRFAANKAKEEIAAALLARAAAAPEVGLAADQEFYEALRGLEDLVGARPGSIPAEQALRAAEFMAGKTGPQLGFAIPADLALEIAATEPLGRKAVRDLFYGKGLGRAFEDWAYDPAANSVLERAGDPTGKVAVDPESSVWVGVEGREGNRQLTLGEMVSARASSAKGNKMGPGKGRNPLFKEKGETLLVNPEDAYLPLLYMERTERVPGRDRLGAATVQTGKWEQGALETLKQGWRKAYFGGSPEERAVGKEMMAAVLSDEGRFQTNAAGNAKRSYTPVPAGVKMAYVNPLMTLEGLDASRVPGISEEEAKWANQLLNSYAVREPLKDKTQTGSFDVVGVPEAEVANLLNPELDPPGFRRQDDPGAVMSREMRSMTLGEAMGRILEDYRTPTITGRLYAGEGGPRVVPEAELRQLYQSGALGDDDLRELVVEFQEQDERGVPRTVYRALQDRGRRGTNGGVVFDRSDPLFPLGEAAQGESGFVQPFRVRENSVLTQKGMEEAENLIKAVLLATGGVRPGDVQLVGNSLGGTPWLNAAQNTATAKVLGSDVVLPRGSFRGSFPEEPATFVGGEKTVYDNPLIGLMQTMSKMRADEFRTIENAEQLSRLAPVALAEGSQEYGAAWNEVAKPALDAYRTRVMAEQGAPGMRQDGLSPIRPALQGATGGGDVVIGDMAVPKALLAALPDTAKTVVGQALAGDAGATRQAQEYLTRFGPQLMERVAAQGGGLAEREPTALERYGAVVQRAPLPAGVGPSEFGVWQRNPDSVPVAARQAIEGWLYENSQSPTRGERVVVGDLSAGRPAPAVVNLAAELEGNRAYGDADTHRIVRASNYDRGALAPAAGEGGITYFDPGTAARIRGALGRR